MDYRTSTGAEHFHAVGFFKDTHALGSSVAKFVADGFKAGKPALIIATPQNRAGILAQLRALDVDTDRLQSNRTLTLLDAETMLDTFVVANAVDEARFTAAVTTALEEARGGRDRMIRVYGEMVDVLWRQDRRPLSLAVEALWNGLADTQRFELLCGYGLAGFSGDATRHEEITRLHSHVVPGEQPLESRGGDDGLC